MHSLVYYFSFFKIYSLKLIIINYFNFSIINILLISAASWIFSTFCKLHSKLDFLIESAQTAKLIKSACERCDMLSLLVIINLLRLYGKGFIGTDYDVK